MDSSIFAISVTTFACSLLSLLGSILVLLSYVIASTNSKPKAAQLIRNLALADFFWFLSSLIQATYWLFTTKNVPTVLCFVCSPIVIFTRMASLIWTCAISFDVLMSVNKRKWRTQGEETRWNAYRTRYFLVVLLFALPGALLNVIKQHSTGDSDLGCSPSYEKLGLWYEVFFTELLPIVIGFCFNVYVFFQVRNRMTLKAFPQSVRKKRRRIMYHYIIVCIICWSPTILFYFTEISGLLIPALEMIARASLYLTGFLNFIVFGMQDPHLKKSFLVVMYRLGLSSVAITGVGGDKSVMFEEATITKNADFTKDKRSIYKYHKLSNEDKRILYANRPDLDPKEYTFTEPLLPGDMDEKASSSSQDYDSSDSYDNANNTNNNANSNYSTTEIGGGARGGNRRDDGAGKKIHKDKDKDSDSDFVAECNEAFAYQQSQDYTIVSSSSVFHSNSQPSSPKGGSHNTSGGGVIITTTTTTTGRSHSTSTIHNNNNNNNGDVTRSPIQQQEMMQVTKSQSQSQTQSHTLSHSPPDVEASLVDDVVNNNGVMPSPVRSVLGRNEREDTTDDSSDDEDDEDHELANIH